MKDWIERYFKENWKEIKTNIDFSKYKPIHTSNSLHVYEEGYKIDGKIYRLLYSTGSSSEPLIEILV